MLLYVLSSSTHPRRRCVFSTDRVAGLRLVTRAHETVVRTTYKSFARIISRAYELHFFLVAHVPHRLPYLKHPPYEILAMTAECWLLEESRNKLMILHFKDKFLPESSAPLMLHLTTAAICGCRHISTVTDNEILALNFFSVWPCLHNHVGTIHPPSISLHGVSKKYVHRQASPLKSH